MDAAAILQRRDSRVHVTTGVPSWAGSIQINFMPPLNYPVKLAL